LSLTTTKPSSSAAEDHWMKNAYSSSTLHTHRHIRTDTQTYTQTDRQKYTQTDRQTHTDRHTQRHTDIPVIWDEVPEAGVLRWQWCSAGQGRR